MKSFEIKAIALAERRCVISTSHNGDQWVAESWYEGVLYTTGHGATEEEAKVDCSFTFLEWLVDSL